MTIVSLENKLTEVRKEVVTNRRLFQNEIVGLKEELCEVQKQYRRISVKQDQLFLKQDQIQCTLQSDTVTPPIRSPSMLEQASWCKQPHHFTPDNQAPVSARASTSYGDLSSGIGDWDLDTMLQDFDFTGLIMTPAGLQVEDDRLVHESPIADGNHPVGSTAFCKKNRGSAIGAVYKQSTDSAQQSVVGNHPAASSMLAAVKLPTKYGQCSAVCGRKPPSCFVNVGCCGWKLPVFYTCRQKSPCFNCCGGEPPSCLISTCCEWKPPSCLISTCCEWKPPS